ncbi:amino acid ABC transporter permease [Candidatus Spongiihabitans sp.]|uniref:amino acid ABC transporter permease n=1 Tax=Candidatus Spongiihabitans sp. TaxID=3101308 RepID=UPI003C6F8027
MAFFRSISGVNQGLQTELAQTDLPVLKPFNAIGSGMAGDLLFSRWLGAMPSWLPFLVFGGALIWPMLSLAQSNYTQMDAISALWRWLPFLLTSGFLFNIIISVLTMLFGTILGVLLGLCQVSPKPWLLKLSWFITQLFRNSPWLVLLFIVMLSFPFEIRIGDTLIPIPDWVKAVMGLSLPIMANISEIVRGGIQSVPIGQWEAAESLAYSRIQTIRMVILPQCFKRMIPPWMNWYAILTMATPLVSLLGVEELITLSRQAMESENNRPELLVPFYGFALIIFFAYSYPIARYTIALEKRFSVKL